MMSKALTVESCEDELRPTLLKPQDDEFSRQVRISLDLETTNYVGKTNKELTVGALALDRCILDTDRFDYLCRDYRESHSTATLLLSAELMSAIARSYISPYGSVLPFFTELAGSTICAISKLRKEKKSMVSTTGIMVKDEQIRIDPRRLERNAFYLFSYKDEKYVARRTNEYIVEVYEVTE